MDSVWAAAALVISAAAAALVTYVRAWVNAQIETVRDAQVRDRLREAVSTIELAIMSAAGPVEERLMAAGRDGKITAQERREILELVVTHARQARSSAFWLQLAKDHDIDDLPAWIIEHAESLIWCSESPASMPRLCPEAQVATQDAPQEGA